jgi:hypothetical protein
MNEDAQVLDFVKAVSDAERLRIIGMLARGDASMREIADQLGLPFRDVFSHLGLLEFAGVIHKTGDRFRLDDAALESLSKRQLAHQRDTYVPAPDLDAKSRKVLAAYLGPDGSLKQFPIQPAKQRVVLDYLAAEFELKVSYSEKEVNAILRRFHPDTATLRRALIDAGLLARESDGSRYWRR